MIYDDNLFRQAQDERSDQIFVLAPELVLETDWLNHQITARAGASNGRHVDLNAEDYEDYFLSLSPLIDVDENTTLSLDFGYSSTHSERGSTDTLLEGPEPAIDDILKFSANWVYQSDKYSARLLYEFSQDDALDNGLIERDFLDNSSQVLVFRQGYDFTTGTTGWIQPGLEWIDYRLSRDDSGLVRDNQGWTLLAGVTINRTAVSFLELGLGAMSRSFEQTGQDDFFGFAYVGRLLWNITPLVTLDISAGRSARVVQSTTGPIAVDDEVTLELAWDPLENLIFQAAVSFTRSDYETLPGQARTEDLVEANLNMRYLLNENMYLEANYDFGNLSSNLIGDDYESNLLSIRAGVEL